MRSRTPVHRWAARGGVAAFAAVALVTGALAAATSASAQATDAATRRQSTPARQRAITCYPVAGHHDYAAACAEAHRRPHDLPGAGADQRETAAAGRSSGRHPRWRRLRPGKACKALTCCRPRPGAPASPSPSSTPTTTPTPSPTWPPTAAAGSPRAPRQRLLQEGQPERRDQPAAGQRPPAAGPGRSRSTWTWPPRSAPSATSSWSRRPTDSPPGIAVNTAVEPGRRSCPTAGRQRVVVRHQLRLEYYNHPGDVITASPATTTTAWSTRRPRPTWSRSAAPR